jgi:hypothetical protein
MAVFGAWWNELNSKMVIKRDHRDARQIHGRYHTNVGNAQQKSYPLVGRIDAWHSPQRDQVISWVVVWDPPDPPANPNDPPNEPSITAWSGQYHVDANTGIEFISATWLLTRMTEAGDDWKSTLVSMDFFFRSRPTPKMLQIARRVGKAASHLTAPIKPKRRA